jgi:hypothetical protein
MWGGGCLIEALSNEVGREATLEELFVFEGVVTLHVPHAPAFSIRQHTSAYVRIGEDR